MKYLTKALICCCVILSLWNESEATMCRAIAFRGGGDKGPYEVGALRALVEYLKPSDVEYDVVGGISIGAFNGAVLASFPKGYEL